MAKKKQSASQVFVLKDSGEAIETEEPVENPDELRALSEIDSGSDVKWVVTRVSDIGTKKAGYCGELSTGDLSLAKIAEEWGIGKYRIRGTRSNGQFAGQSTVTIAEGAKGSQVTQTLMPTGPANSIQDMIALMDARDEKSNEKMLKWATILTPLLAPALANLFGGQKGTTLAELTTALANIKALDGGGKVDQMQEFTKLLELVKQVQGDGTGVAGSNWVDVFRDGIKELPAIVGGVAAAARGQAAPAAGATGNGQQKQLTQEQTMLAWLKQQLEALTYQAARNRDPGLYSEVMLDNLPPDANVQQLYDYLSREDWWSLLTTFSPGVQPHGEWFAECRVELLKGLKTMLTPPDQPPPKTAPKPAAKKAA